VQPPLTEQLQATQQLVDQLRADLAQAHAAREAAEAKAQRCLEEVQAQHFINSVLEQRVEEQDIAASEERMNRNEAARDLSRKHKEAIKRVELEKKQYEERANQLIEELEGQMNSIQAAAMERITELEEQILAERERARSEVLGSSDVYSLRSAVAGGGGGGSGVHSATANAEYMEEEEEEEEEGEEEGDGYDTEEEDRETGGQ
jgi:hypothetical protein